MKTFVANPRFALADLGCAIVSGAIWYAWPAAGGWPLLIALLPWAIRITTGRFPFTRTVFDLPIAAFLVTAALGVWAMYDPQGGWSKFWILVGAVFLYYALAGQPQGNLWLVTGLLGLFGMFAAGLFLLGEDFQKQPADLQLVQWMSQGWMSIRPGSLRTDFQPNFIGGILAVLAPFPIAHGWVAVRNRDKLAALFAALAAGLIGCALLLTSSRGAWLALAVALGVWLTRELRGYAARRYPQPAHRWFALAALFAAVPALWFVILIPDRAVDLADQLPGTPSAGSRLELARNTLFLIEDFPFTGGGLGAFPGLYSQYVMVIPFYLFGYSHNFFLDVALEQGIFGFLALAAILFGSSWLVVFSSVFSTGDRREDLSARFLSNAVLAGLIVAVFHGLVDDPLYGNRGTPLVFFLPALAVALSREMEVLKALRQVTSSRIPTAIHEWGGKRLAGVHNWKWLVAAGLAFSLLAGMFCWKPLLASWYANLGAVRMSRAELPGFPKEEWDADGYSEADVSASIRSAGLLFNRSLELDPHNATAGYRLGLIYWSERDFSKAIENLEIAHQAKPDHRGISKVLGYGYAWAGEFDQALLLLEGIPEASAEMTVYTGWWKERGREDLASRSAGMATLLENAKRISK